METSPGKSYEFGEFRLDPEKRLFQRRDGAPVPLTPRVFDTLLYFVQHAGRVLDKEVLMEAIWPDSIVEENNLSQNISRLRRVLGEKPGSHLFIVTVPGRGFRFVAPVKMSDDGTPTTEAGVRELTESVSPASAERAPRPWLNRSLLPVALILLLLAAALVLWRVHSHPSRAQVRTLAVLPFKPVVLKESDPILELGMADTLITNLSRSRGLIVRPLSTVRRYDSPEQDPVKAGSELKVAAVLDGSIQRRGNRMRVTARLINVPDGSSLWAETFDEQAADVFLVQDVISQKVVEALAGRLSGEERKRLSKRGTENIAAYQLYLTGRYHWNKLIPPELLASIGYFQQATRLDPHYAQAYFGLAEAYRALAITGDMPPNETMPQAKAAAHQALAIDDSLAEAHASLVFIHTWYDWDWIAAEREARRAIALDPNLAIAHSAYAQTLSDRGRHEEAIAEAAQGRELDPVSLIINTIEGSVLYFAKRPEAAERSLQKTLQLDSRFWIARLFLGKVYIEQKRFPEAMEQFEEARQFSGGNSETLSMIGYLWAIQGEAAKARDILAEMKRPSSVRYVPPFNLAVVHLGLGERDQVFDALEKAYQDHDVRLSFLKVDLKWDPLRSDPRFVSLIERLGF